MHLMKKTREEQVVYHKSVESFQNNKKGFTEQHGKLLARLDLKALDELMNQTRKEMSSAWNTIKLKKSMKEFFDLLSEITNEASQLTDQVNTMVQTLYRQFHKEHGLAEVKPKLFSMGKYKRDIERLYHEAEAYRNSPVSTMTEQAFVIKKFFISMVSHARNTFFQAHQEAEAWGKQALHPLVSRIKEHKHQMEKRLESLRKINESRDTLQARIDDLEHATRSLKTQLDDITTLRATLNRPLESFIDEAKASNAA